MTKKINYYSFVAINVFYLLIYIGIAVSSYSNFFIFIPLLCQLYTLWAFPYRDGFLISEIKSKSGNLHFRRWKVVELPNFAIYIHKIYVEDKDSHLHNHPWDYTNIILKGGYMETRLDENGEECNHVMLPYKRTKRNAGTYHKISSVFGTTTTLFVTNGRKYEWGYNVNGEHVDNKQYRINKNLGLYNNG